MKRGEVAAQVEVLDLDNDGETESEGVYDDEEQLETADCTSSDDISYDVGNELRSLDRRLHSLSIQVSRILVAVVCGVVLSGLAWSRVAVPR